MAEEYRGSQYDDDLTVGLDDVADESFDTGYVDLFEYAGEEESPISRLKTIMLSIEWEITDDVLIDFNDELLSAQQEWVDDPVKQVYIQALQKISKYIYQKKSDSHHNAMKVMIAFFYDLEKIVLDTEISEEAKREILFEDVKKFERLKKQIGLSGEPEKSEDSEIEAEAGVKESRKVSLETSDTNPDLYKLKAYILGIDWEITDKELTEISTEVKNLQQKWSGNKAHMLLLQGIDTLGGYIKLMKSQSHADAFKLLNSFFLVLEKVVDETPGYEETKELLLIEAEKFNKFKEEIAASITPEAIAEQKQKLAAVAEEAAGPEIEDGLEDKLDIQDTSEFEQAALADDFGDDEDFSEETLEKVSSFFGDLEAGESDDFAALSTEDALRGVDVETEADDDSDEEALPTFGDGVLAPALAGLEGDDSADVTDSPIPGVDVESDEDDDTGEAPLPFADGELAPALFGGEEVDADGSAAAPGADSEGEINRHVDDFFSDELFGDEAEGKDDHGAVTAPALSGYVDELGDDGEAAEGSDHDGIEGELDSFLSEDTAGAEKPAVDDEQFTALKTKVEGLETDLNEAALASIQTELAAIKQTLANRPIEKTLTQLVSTVVENIDAESGDSEDDAIDLLKSVFSNLEQIRSSSVDQDRALELLSDETERILKWQQQRLRR